MSTKDIGRKIQMAREERGMSQEQLARLMGCSQSALSNYEKGKRRLYLSHLEKFSEILDKPLEYFMEELVSPSVETTPEPGSELLKLIHLIYQLSDEQVKDVLCYVDFLRWKENRRGL